MVTKEAYKSADRHMIRHKEKDDEAGGEGLGILATRKKLWRDANGNIVNAPRPYHQEGTKRRQLTAKYESLESGTLEQNDPSKSNVAVPPSTPTSLPGTRDIQDEQIGGSGALKDDWAPMGGNNTQLHDDRDASDFLCNASWGSEPFQGVIGASSDLPYDDMFKPDTGMSRLQSLRVDYI